MILNKRKTAHFLRRIYLLQFVDKLMFVADILKNRKSNQFFLAEHPDFPPPPACLAYDAYNHTNWQAYYDMGLKHSGLISDLIREYVHEKEIKILEWGCGPARVVRHLGHIAGFDKIELFGTDYNEDSIVWCNDNIKNVRFSKNSLEPPLPMANASFDCVYAISIFTHLSEKMHFAWVEELFRLVKPNGIVIFTTHGDLCAKKLLPGDKALYDAGLLVIKGKVQEGKKHFAAFQPPQFVKTQLLRDYVVVKHMSNPAPYQLEQEVWVAQKKAAFPPV